MAPNTRYRASKPAGSPRNKYYSMWDTVKGMDHGGPMAQKYEKSGVNYIGNSNNSIIFIEEELITKDLK